MGRYCEVTSNRPAAGNATSYKTQPRNDQLSQQCLLRQVASSHIAIELISSLSAMAAFPASRDTHLLPDSVPFLPSSACRVIISIS